MITFSAVNCRVGAQSNNKKDAVINPQSLRYKAQKLDLTQTRKLWYEKWRNPIPTCDARHAASQIVQLDSITAERTRKFETSRGTLIKTQKLLSSAWLSTLDYIKVGKYKAGSNANHILKNWAKRQTPSRIWPRPIEFVITDVARWQNPKSKPCHHELSVKSWELNVSLNRYIKMVKSNSTASP